jgi:ketosteroid isomerase-like protein
MKHLFLLLAICLGLLAVFASNASEPLCSHTGESGEVDNIQNQRQLFNRAIMDKDIRAIDNVLHDEVILITGTDSDVYTGKEAQLAIWSSDFSKPDRAVYVRTPTCIRVSPVFPVALEYGTWRGEKTDGAGSFAAGSYAAKWRNVDELWRLESEIFATEDCGGDFCPESAGKD